MYSTVEVGKNYVVICPFVPSFVHRLGRVVCGLSSSFFIKPFPGLTVLLLLSPCNFVFLAALHGSCMGTPAHMPY